MMRSMSALLCLSSSPGAPTARANIKCSSTVHAAFLKKKDVWLRHVVHLKLECARAPPNMPLPVRP